ncbi:phage integrase N-terminal SAM-like domain-containing protein [Bradyrhizobium sp. WSM3983]|uniref:phage integrase N-terminal SAM-like domain-containing protein n=1 Tax=Bradyrhizobium sp. WSM3983 TaxID=1038867 RepID=UPI00040C2BC5|nr:phage integrase N-terminal SAM-like domain-containing protein [Bradyrhizobium sp. WSM3983]
MTDEAVSPLRRRMIEDMTIRKFAPKTQHDYVQRVKDFAAFLGRSPDTADFEDVRRYQLHLAASGVGVPTINLLRRPHDHHRGLRARCNATASTDGPTESHQDRHLMTASQSRQSARRVRRLSTSHGRARPDIRQPSQIARQFTEFDAARRSFASRFTVARLARSARSQPTSSSAALKSP